MSAPELPLLVGLPPVADARTRMMVLGSFPGTASLAAGQYYAHPRNQFWPILSGLWGIDLVAMPYAARLEHMLSRGLGLWDAYAHCRRAGSLDSAIVAPQPNDLATLRSRAPHLMAIVHNGGKSARSMRHVESLGFAVAKLPSTSPAHASWPLQRKLAAWRDTFKTHGLA